MLRPGRTSLGSGADNVLVVHAVGVSRRHAAVHLTSDGELTVEDLGSKNGTWLNGVRVAHATLRPDDWVQLGPVALQLEVIDPDDAVLALRGAEAPGPTASSPRKETLGWAPDSAGEVGETLVFVRHVLPSLLAPGSASMAPALAELGRVLRRRGRKPSPVA